jgi:hypothetical protein
MKTKIILIVASVVLIIINIILIATGNTSMSSTIAHFSGKYPIIPCGIGILIGHWLWRVGEYKE